MNNVRNLENLKMLNMKTARNLENFEDGKCSKFWKLLFAKIIKSYLFEIDLKWTVWNLEIYENGYFAKFCKLVFDGNGIEKCAMWPFGILKMKTVRNLLWRFDKYWFFKHTDQE